MTKTFFMQVFVLSVMLVIICLTAVPRCVFSSPKRAIEVAQKRPADRTEIRVNQLGYYPGSVKRFAAVNTAAKDFSVQDVQGKTVYRGKLVDRGSWKDSGEQVKTGDFSPLRAPGKYVIVVNSKKSSIFEIKSGLYRDVFIASAKSFYYQRASSELLVTHAGQWKRPGGHPDTKCYYHPSSGRSHGFGPSPGGWYDAGDYNKYIVNAGVSVCTMLGFYELYPGAIADRHMNIPESGNGRSDLLDEIKYELDWVLTMQDGDGGVFHKLTSKRFTPFFMPREDKTKRWFVGKTTAAALNFAAMTAQAARVYAPFDKPFADRCLAAAKKAWDWAVKNPKQFYRNPPDINTGEYYDAKLADEFFWAGAELLITTGDKKYLPYIEPHFDNIVHEKVASWSHFVDKIACFSLAALPDKNGTVPGNIKKKARAVIFRLADANLKEIEAIPYRIPVNHFKWGNNGETVNDALILSYAFRLSHNKKYLDAAIETMDYIFGKNAVGYCFVTGFGSNPPMNPHWRISGSDRIDDPHPGFLAGGANKQRQDLKALKDNGVAYPYPEPARCYIDNIHSFASNEICINWNAPLTAVLGMLEEFYN